MATDDLGSRRIVPVLTGRTDPLGRKLMHANVPHDVVHALAPVAPRGDLPRIDLPRIDLPRGDLPRRSEP